MTIQEMKAVAILQAESQKHDKRGSINYHFLLGLTSIIANLNMKCVVKGKHIYNIVNIGDQGLWSYVEKYGKVFFNNLFIVKMCFFFKDETILI